MAKQKNTATATKALQTPSLQGCTITFNSNSLPADAIDGKSYKAIKDEIVQNGGEFVAKVGDCTHLVLTQAQYEKSNQKVQDAKANSGVTIVSFDWLKKALEGNGPVPTGHYILEDEQQNATIPSAMNGVSNEHTTNLKVDIENDTSVNKDTSDKQPPSKKRKRDEDDGEEEKVNIDVKKQDTGSDKATNMTKNFALRIPLDEGLRSIASTWTVHIGDDSTIFDATLNQSNSGKNANKFYRMQLLRNGSLWYTWTRWGRVGEHGQTKMLGPATFDQALVEFKKKFKDKTGNTWEDRNGQMHTNKYVFIEKSYEESDDDEKSSDSLPGAEKRKKAKEEAKNSDEEKVVIKSKLPEPVQNLLKLIFNQDYFNNTFAAFDYDAQKMPLGKLSKSSLIRGYDVLKQLASLVGSPGTNATQISDLSNQYLSLIPHVVSRSSRPPVLADMGMIKREIELLETLTDMQLANDLMKDAKKSELAEEVSLLDRQYAGLGMQAMDPVDRSSAEFQELSTYLKGTIGHSHGTRYQIQDIFRVERNGEHVRFENSKYASIKNKNRRLLWHGSRTTNFGGILSQGLRIAPPEAPVSGYMFGKGVYLADMSSKSANYCASHSSGNIGLLLLCEAELGEPPLKLTNADYNAGTQAQSKNLLSTWGVGQTAPQKWKDAGCIHPNLKGVSMPDVGSVGPGPTKESGAYLMYNEFIVYDVAQIKLRYLFRVSM